jgi:hypothetical protein
MELAIQAAREYARPESLSRRGQILDSIRGLIGGRIGVPVPRVAAEAMGLNEATIENWPANL